MTVRRVMGIETEYGISVPGDPTANPMLLSGHVVNAYANRGGARAAEASWDYEDEAPLRDARGFEMGRGSTPTRASSPTRRTRPSPTWCSPTAPACTSTTPTRSTARRRSPRPRAAVTWDRAGERIMLRGGAPARPPPGVPGVNLYKNNTDGKGASYGTHENYLMRRETPFARHRAPPHPVLRRPPGHVRGRAGSASARTPRSRGYQIAQRADFFEVEVGLETTLKRPIINTRDEPHAVADRYRRLHVIIGDANQCDVANLLKIGTTRAGAGDDRGPAPSPRTWP